MTDGTVWVTSAWRPAPDSYHNLNQAFDIRIKNVKGFNAKTFSHSSIIANWAYRIQQTLGPAYDVIYGTPEHYNHIHIEYEGE